MIWLKKWWWVLVAAAALVAGGVLWVLTAGRVRMPDTWIPPRPKTPDVKTPDVVELNLTPADDYEDKKVDKVDDVADSINERYGK